MSDASDIRVVSAAEIAEDEFVRFIQQVYHAETAAYILANRNWLYRDFSQSLGALKGDTLVGFSGTIPFQYSYTGQVHDGLWWVNLIVDPAERGKGIQRLIGDALKSRGVTKGAFTNVTSHAIFGKQGWIAVTHFKTRLLPLRFSDLKQIKHAEGSKGKALRTAAWLAGPVNSLLRLYFRSYTARYSRKVDIRTHIELLAQMYQTFNQPAPIITNVRDRAYLTWRYLQCPHADEIICYVAQRASDEAPAAALTARIYRDSAGLAVRILDLFGDLSSKALLNDLMRALIRDAVQAGVYQVTVMDTLHDLRPLLLNNGFVLSSMRHFNWYDQDAALMALFQQNGSYWVIADSDNDAVPR